MKKQHEEWLENSGWKFIYRSGYGVQRVCCFDLSDRRVISFATIKQFSDELIYTPGAGINFEEFIKLGTKIGGKKDSANTLRLQRMTEPYRFLSTTPSCSLIETATNNIAEWANSLDLKAVVQHEARLKNDEGDDQFHISIIMHLTALTILGKTDILENHLADTKNYADQPKTPHINMMGEPHIYIERAISLSKDYAKNPFFK